MMLALFDAATDKSLSDISLILGGLMAAIYYGKEIFFPRKSVSPLDVNLVESLATKKELKEVEDDRKEEDRILHKRITDGRTQIDHTLRELPMQIVTLLRNTGTLK